MSYHEWCDKHGREAYEAQRWEVCGDCSRCSECEHVAVEAKDAEIAALRAKFDEAFALLTDVLTTRLPHKATDCPTCALCERIIVFKCDPSLLALLVPTPQPAKLSIQALQAEEARASTRIDSDPRDGTVVVEPKPYVTCGGSGNAPGSFTSEEGCQACPACGGNGKGSPGRKDGAA